MSTLEDVRRIALSLPGAEEAEGTIAYSVPNKGKMKGFVCAILVRLEAIANDELELLITEGWRCLAPKELAELVL